MTDGRSSALVLVGLLDVFSLDDADTIRQRVLDTAAESFEAEVVSIVDGESLVRSVGLRDGDPGGPELIQAITAGDTTVTLPGLGELHLASVPVGGGDQVRFGVARSFAPFSPAELRVTRAMVRIMTLAVRTTAAFGEQREAAALLEEEVARNRELADELHRRHADLMTRMLDIQGRLTSSSGSVLNAVIEQGSALFDRATMAIQIRDERGDLVLHHVSDAATPQVQAWLVRAATDPDGLVAEAVTTNRLVEADPGPAGYLGRPALSAPVHRLESAIGALTLVAADHQPFTRVERETLLLLAGYASVAVGDAAILEERQEALEEAEWQATHDALTGLANRRLVLEEIDRRLAADEHVEVLYIDVDRFKAVNDLYGHLVGDEFIQAVASRLTSAVRARDLVGRLAGDEFIIVCGPNSPEGAAESLAERVGRSMAEPFEINEQSIASSVSVGLANSQGLISASELIHAADVAMYQAKSGGRNRMGLFDEELQQQIRRTAALSEGIGQAAATGRGLHLVYQPIVDIETGEIRSHETLLRYVDPVLGPVPADEFVAQAEELGAIAAIDNWVLETAMQEAADADLQSSLSVNVSPAWLTRTDAVDLVAEAAAVAGFPLDRLSLEVTERVALADNVTATLSLLRQLGIRILLDDFGTGYSSLAYVHRLEIDGIKIDRGFLEGVEGDRHRAAILEAVLILTERLDAIAIAEGVEVASQVELLRSFGCPLAQGYYYGRPAPAPDGFRTSITLSPELGD